MSKSVPTFKKKNLIANNQRILIKILKDLTKKF